MKAVGQDPVVSARILAFANSAHVAPAAEVGSIRQAAVLLGLRRVAEVAACVAGGALFDPASRVRSDMFGDCWRRIHHHAMTSALTSSWLAMKLGPSSSDAFLAGLLHALGKPFLLQSLGAVLVSVEGVDAPDEDVVDDVLELLLPDANRALMGAWNVPTSVRNVCCPGDVACVTDELRHDQHVVNVAAGFDGLRLRPRLFLPREDALSSSIAALGLSRRDLRALRRQLDEFAATVDALLAAGAGACADRAVATSTPHLV